MTESTPVLAIDLHTVIDIPPNGTLSRTLISDHHGRVVIFGFDAGQELTKHTSAYPAIIQIIKGQATIQLGENSHEAQAGFLAHMPANLPHSIVANTPVIMLLMLQQS
ncbi:MAG: cupin domain-containing protein [Roseiflexaceae bacterium]|nr:cupin domain-containing protein [Roseiflexaceae bacterium]